MTCAQISNVTANYCRAEEYEQRIAQLEAENAALLDRISAEAGLRVDTEAERDTALDNLRAADKELRGKNDLWDQKITQAYEFMQQRDAARQSRARLVRLVRALRAKLSETMPDSAFVKRITDERDQYITQYTQVKQVAEGARLEISALNEMIDDLTAERDAARAWAAAWRSCAHWWFYVPRETDRYWFKDEFADQARQRRAARRAADAADAMERR